MRTYRRRTAEQSSSLAPARLRNVIERVIGQFKARFPIFTSRMYYGYHRRTQGQLVTACCVIHNFTKRRSFEYKWRDVIFERSDETLRIPEEREYSATCEDPIGTENETRRTESDKWRDDLSKEMWANRRRRPA